MPSAAITPLPLSHFLSPLSSHPLVLSNPFPPPPPPKKKTLLQNLFESVPLNPQVQKGAYVAGQPATHKGKIQYPECKKGVWPPSNWDPRIAERWGRGGEGREEDDECEGGRGDEGKQGKESDL